jgi:hypothetical protein
MHIGTLVVGTPVGGAIIGTLLVGTPVGGAI